MTKVIQVDGDGRFINPVTGLPLLPMVNPNPSPTGPASLPSVDIPPSKYEVKLDSFFVLRFGLLMHEERILVIHKDQVTVKQGAEEHWIKFRLWKYREELEWKNKATEFDADKRMHMLNNDRLNELKLRNLMLSWSFSEHDPALTLLHVNGYMSDESYNRFMNLHPNIIHHVIVGMNEVLEYNG